MMLTSYKEFISESTDKKFDPYADMRAYYKKKKMGLRNLDSWVIYRSGPRSWPQINHNALRSLYVTHAQQDLSLVNEHNWSYIMEGFHDHNLDGDNGVKLAKLIVEKYTPSEKQIATAFENSIGKVFPATFEQEHRSFFRLGKRDKKEFPVADYLFTQLSTDYLQKKLFWDCIPYGISKSQTLLKVCSYLVANNIFTCGEAGPRQKHINAEDGLRMTSFSETEYAGWLVLLDPKCEYTEAFFEKFQKHPNNGGMNANDRIFAKKVVLLYHSPNFRKYVEEHSEKFPNLEKIYNKVFHESEEDY